MEGAFIAEYLGGRFELLVSVGGVLPDDVGLVVGLMGLDIALRRLMRVDSSGTSPTVVVVTADFDLDILVCRSDEKLIKCRACNGSVQHFVGIYPPKRQLWR